MLTLFSVLLLLVLGFYALLVLALFLLPLYAFVFDFGYRAKPDVDRLFNARVDFQESRTLRTS
jgi:hypothetical protein